MKNEGNDWRQAHAELLRIAGEHLALDRDEGRWLLAARRARVHVELGYATFAEYIERVLGYGPRTTEDKLRVAEALEQLPQLSASDLSWSALRELTRVATPATERAWIDAAKTRTVRDIERLVSGRAPGDGPADSAAGGSAPACAALRCVGGHVCHGPRSDGAAAARLGRIAG